MIVNKILKAIAILSLLLLMTACHPRSHLLEPKLDYTPKQQRIACLPTEFPPLTDSEKDTEWGRELIIGRCFAKELDLYRAITSLKRSLFLLPEDCKIRRAEIEFTILYCYFVGKKYQEVVNTFELGAIRSVQGSFPSFRELLIILYESYLKTGNCKKAHAVLQLMEKGDVEAALDLKLFTALDAADLATVQSLAMQHGASDDIMQFSYDYHQMAKSVKKAQFLNAVLPGAGYYYVGQKKSALTSFIINTSFIAATYYFFDKGNWGAGLFTASLECGWYFGGINGAGLAAKEYNERLYKERGENLMIKRTLFPVLMLQVGF